MNPKSSWRWRKHHLPRGFSFEDLMMRVRFHLSHRYEYEILDHYYVGRQDILNRSYTDPTKPNNMVVHNFAKLITDTNASYFLGKPVTYVAKNADTVTKVEEVLWENDSRDIDAELGKLASIHGHAMEFHWIDNEGKHRFKFVRPKDALIIYSADMAEEMLAAVNIARHKDDMTGMWYIYLEVYDKDTITSVRYIEGEEVNPDIIDVKPHPFGEVPCIEYIANEERQGDFENVLSLIDAYDNVVSDSVNDVEYWNDSYLLLRDLQATTIDDINAMKQNRVLMVDGTGTAEFITKHINDTHVENVKNRLVDDIHLMANTPSLVGEKFATNLSGTAIKYKLMMLEYRTSIRERKFYNGMLKRLRLIFNTLNLRGEELVNDMRPVFIRNIPANLTELADSFVKLRGIVSDETLRAQLPFVTDLEKEEELVNEQKLEDLEMMMFPTTGILPKEIDTLPENNLKGWTPPPPTLPANPTNTAKTGTAMQKIGTQVDKGAVQ